MTEQNPPVDHEPTFVETALKLGGKSDEEARKTGAIDRADEQVESLFDPKYQTINSPIHLAIWGGRIDSNNFTPKPVLTSDSCQGVISSSLAAVQKHKKAGTLLNDAKKITPEVLNELGACGYWGMLVDKEYGGQSAPFRVFANFITQMATIDPTVAGLASVHGCIGAVDPIRTFGSDAQKKEFLPDLASGKRLSGFALTEPCAGSDMTALKTTATLEGDHYLVNGEKLFITNAIYGRTIGLVCLIDEKNLCLNLRSSRRRFRPIPTRHLWFVCVKTFSQ